MSEITAKRRGRPPKKEAEAAAGQTGKKNASIVVEPEETILEAGAPRPKRASKKSTSTPSSPSTTTAVPKKTRAKKDAPEVGKAASPTKKKSSPATKTSSTALPSSEPSEATVQAPKNAESQVEPRAESQPEVQSLNSTAVERPEKPGPNGEEKPPLSVSSSRSASSSTSDLESASPISSTPSASQTESAASTEVSSASSATQETPTVGGSAGAAVDVGPESTITVSSRGEPTGRDAFPESTVLLSKILNRAQAFSKESTDLHQSVLEATAAASAAAADAFDPKPKVVSGVSSSLDSMSNPPPPPHLNPDSTVAFKPKPKYVVPPSTMTALAARAHTFGGQQQLRRQHQQHQARPPRLPIQRPPPDLGAPKPSQIPLEELKKDPKYRSLSRRWTTLMVSLPVAIVTSYFLWQRYDEHQSYLRTKDRQIVDSAGTTTTTVPTTPHTTEEPGR